MYCTVPYLPYRTFHTLPYLGRYLPYRARLNPACLLRLCLCQPLQVVPLNFLNKIYAPRPETHVCFAECVGSKEKKKTFFPCFFSTKHTVFNSFFPCRECLPHAVALPSFLLPWVAVAGKISGIYNGRALFPASSTFYSLAVADAINNRME